MTDVSTLELRPNHGRPDTVISPSTLLNKGGSVEAGQEQTGPLDLAELDSWLNRSFGMALHAAFREIASQKLTPPTHQLKMELPRPSVEEIVGKKTTNWGKFCQEVTRESTVLNPKAIEKAAAWLESFQAYSLPDSIKARLRPDQKIYFREQRKTAMETHALLLCGLIELWPPMKQANTLVLSEVRFQPPTFAVEQLGKELARPAKLKTALAAGIKEGETLDDLLFGILVKKQPLLANFDNLVQKLIELKEVKDQNGLIQALAEPKEKEFAGRFEKLVNKRNLDPAELDTLKTLRLLQQARLQMEFFLGGKARIKTKEELIELLEIFPLTNSENGLPAEEVKSLWDKLPKKTKRILSPIFMTADILIFELPQNQKELLLKLKKLTAEAYGKNNHPALLQNPKFMELITEAAAKGMTVKLGDIKSSRGPIPQQRVETKHSRELGFYNLVLGSAAVAGWLHNRFPTQTFSIFELLRHPLVRSLKENFIFYFGYEKKGKKILPQIASRTAFINPAEDKKLRRRFAILMHQINNSMLIRHVK